MIPPDLDVLFPLGALPERLAGLTRPVLAATPTLDCLRSLDRGRAQSEVLQELLRQLEPWCGPRAIVVFRDGFVVGWSGAGFTEEDPVRGWRGPVVDSPAFKKVSEGVPVRVAVGDDKLLSAWLPVADGGAIIVPVSLRGKVVGGLLALAGERPVIAETVQLFAYLTGLLLETLDGEADIAHTGARRPDRDPCRGASGGRGGWDRGARRLPRRRLPRRQRPHPCSSPPRRRLR